MTTITNEAQLTAFLAAGGDGQVQGMIPINVPHTITKSVALFGGPGCGFSGNFSTAYPTYMFGVGKSGDSLQGVRFNGLRFTAPGNPTYSIGLCMPAGVAVGAMLVEDCTADHLHAFFAALDGSSAIAEVQASTRIQIRRCMANTFSKVAVFCNRQRMTDLLVGDCDFDGNSGDGTSSVIYCSTGFVDYVTGGKAARSPRQSGKFVISGNRITRSKKMGIEMQTQHHPEVTGNMITTCSSYGISVAQCLSGKIAGNTVDAATAIGIELGGDASYPDAVEGGICSGNTVKNLSNPAGNAVGIIADGVVDWIIRDNIIRDITGTGAKSGIIMIHGSKEILVRGNSLKNYGEDGIRCNDDTSPGLQNIRIINNDMLVEGAYATAQLNTGQYWNAVWATGLMTGVLINTSQITGSLPGGAPANPFKYFANSGTCYAGSGAVSVPSYFTGGNTVPS